ncbi:alpha/beta hydrolase fold-domain-containing protein [Absidia repens]|uniref:Alpha/beta hydrolase fold-domain-containing protein n=1 Tax=Absidia repens TaxID=90262 RepID=A0A1X2I8E5_9FUNG|nr:alpha/beta hydrolase fold-domain-containing protein [Absidia repens]
MSTVFLSEDGPGMKTKSSSGPAPAHPLYVQGMAAFKSSGISLADRSIIDKRDLLNNPPPPKGLPEIAPIITKEIPTSAENGTGKVTLTLLRPKGSENEILPVAVYLHGGGWIVGSLKVSEKFVKDLVVKARIVVVYVEYSLSPEVKYPVALEEIYSSILWVYENAASINVDPSKLTVLGDSAGGNLSAAVAILLKQRGHGNVVKNQILMYPAVAFDRECYDSFYDYGGGDNILTIDALINMGSLYHEDKYQTKRGNSIIHGPEHVLNSPLLGSDDELKGLPRCLVVSAECDVLRDEGEHYARRLTEVGVETCAVRVIGAVHGFLTSPTVTPQYRSGVSIVAGFLNE